MAPITAARSTLADGWTTMTNATSATAASATAKRGPTNAAVSSTAPQTIVTFAPDTAVRCVSPDARNSAAVSPVSAEVSPRTSAGSIAAWSAGKRRAGRVGERGAYPLRRPLNRRGFTERRLASCRQNGDGEVAPRRPGDPGIERGGLARRQLGEADDGGENHDAARRFVSRRRSAAIRGTSSCRRPATAAISLGVTMTAATVP